MSTSPDPFCRPVPRLGGFRLGVVAIEIRRLLRNRRTIIFTLVTPVIFFFLFGVNNSYADEKVGTGNVSAAIMVSMALYGAVLATTSGGATVSIERSAGWSRLLRVTPLRPAAYVAVKLVTSLVLALCAVGAVYVAGLATGEPSMPPGTWFVTGAVAWVGSLTFGALGLFVGYLLASEHVMQILGFLIMLCSFAGGLFVPLSEFSPPLRRLARFTPLYGLNQLVHDPLLHQPVHLSWVLNVVVWFALFAAGAAWRFRRDTARV